MSEASRLDMVMAYFSPPRSFRRVMKQLAKRGRVRMVMAGKSDNTTTIAAARGFYPQLRRAGVEIAEFRPCKLHMKLLVIDDVTYFGSANFDHRSIRLNLELMVRVESAELAEKMRDMVDHLYDASDEISADWIKERGTWFNRFRWWLGRFIVSGVDYTIARRLNLKT